MKRRHFVRDIVLASLCFSGSLLPHKRGLSAHTKEHHPWILLYWMPYDNDLSDYGQPILDMLTLGTQNRRTLVLVGADFWRSPHLFRYKISNGNLEEIPVIQESNSSSIQSFNNYLDWAHTNFSADHWSVIIVGHGGKNNQISPDDHVIPNQSSWMQINEIAQTLKDFTQKLTKKLDLLFFQNCNKATLEVIYEVKDSAQYTLASQLLLGAPNYYYQDFLTTLDNPYINAKEAGLAIINTESKQMYNTLTLIDNSFLQDLPKYIDDIFLDLMNQSVSFTETANILTYQYAEETYCDLLSFFDALVDNTKMAGQSSSLLKNFVEQKIVVEHDHNGLMMLDSLPHRLKNRDYVINYLNQFCGIGLLFPSTLEEAQKYRDFELYQDTSLLRLYEILLT